MARTATAAPDCPLTPRELAVLGVLAAGGGSAGAAKVLGTSPHTIKRHMDHIRTKLGVTTRAAAVAVAVRQGWI